MSLRLAGSSVVLAAVVLFGRLPSTAVAATVKGTASPFLESGQFMELTVTINDTKTRFELTGPDYSWFAFGFDTNTMEGYTLIIEGLNATRTAVEQNLVGIGDPGVPQATQNISILDVSHDAANDLTTIVLERNNDTGDPDDAIFSPSMTSLTMIAAYDALASPAFPNGNLSFHTRDGRGFGLITFEAVPEPTTVGLLVVGLLCVASRRRR